MILYFATTSDVKFDQYHVIFAEFNVELRRAATISVLNEPQLEATDDQTVIVAHPLRQAARFVQKSGHIPYMIEDTTLVINHFSAPPIGPAGLPGADTKSWWRNLHTFGVLRLMENAVDRGATFGCQIGVYFGSGIYKFFKAELKGSIATEYKVSPQAQRDVPRSNPFYFHSIFVPTGGSRTLGELSGDEFAIFDYRRACAKQVADAVRTHAADLHRQGELRF